MSHSLSQSNFQIKIKQVKIFSCPICDFTETQMGNLIHHLNIKGGVMILGLIAFGTNSTGVYVENFKYCDVTLISKVCKNSLNVSVLCFGLDTIIFLLT